MLKTTQTIKQITKSTSTRYLKRANAIKSSNFYMELDTLKAYSYNWWLFCTTVNGKVIFNNTTYSATTCKHQGKALAVLDYETDLTLRRTTKNLTDLPIALDNEIDNTKYEISQLIATIKKPRTHKAKNDERRESIKQLLEHIGRVRAFKAEVL